MRISSLDYVLPKDRIAVYPLASRDESKLMVFYKDTGKLEHRRFKDLTEYLTEKDALVLNETRVIPARVYGKPENSSETEFLFVRFEGETALAMVRGLKKLKTGTKVDFGDGLSGTCLGRREELGEFKLNKTGDELSSWLEKHGHVPLPPYIPRPDENADRERYQTVFAARNGSCAAPTAGLHFTEELIDALTARGVKIFKVCLHVGPGTFRPLEGDDVSQNKPSEEFAEVPNDVFNGLMQVKKNGGKVVAVGTTTARALETAMIHGGEFSGFTKLFILPGFDFRMVDAMVTNFHLPRSSLLALVCAFAGAEKVLSAYETAIKEGYRFYSYGDAMLIL
jgi:S-adenosylmethionine:tRNA ribosyltransferase-isomerase